MASVAIATIRQQSRTDDSDGCDGNDGAGAFLLMLLLLLQWLFIFWCCYLLHRYQTGHISSSPTVATKNQRAEVLWHSAVVCVPRWAEAQSGLLRKAF